MIVIPHGTMFTVLPVVFELSLGVMILSRGELVKPGLIGGAGFSLTAALASSIRESIANLGLAIAFAVLALVN